MPFIDPYFDENIGDLRNLLGAVSTEELKKLEPQVVFANELELDSVEIARANDLIALLKCEVAFYTNNHVATIRRPNRGVVHRRGFTAAVFVAQPKGRLGVFVFL
jgi:hypothetical protein